VSGVSFYGMYVIPFCLQVLFKLLALPAFLIRQRVHPPAVDRDLFRLGPDEFFRSSPIPGLGFILRACSSQSLFFRCARQVIPTRSWPF